MGLAKMNVKAVYISEYIGEVTIYNVTVSAKTVLNGTFGIFDCRSIGKHSSLGDHSDFTGLI